jgi:hypothetical protein
MLGQSRQSRGECIDEGTTQTTGGPVLQRTKIQLQPDDREARVQRGADVDGSIKNAHGVLLI